MKNKLNELANQIRQCAQCPLWKSRTHAVPGEGPASAQLMFIGEAPGVEEDKQGLPFVGRSGELLNKLLESNGIHRENIYITSAVKCHPPKNRKPTTQELKICKKLWLNQQIREIKPEYIIILGGIAMKTLIGEDKLEHNHGKIQKKDHQTYFITYHPAAGLRSLNIKHKLEQDFRKLKNMILKIP